MKLNPDLYCFYRFSPTPDSDLKNHCGYFQLLYPDEIEGGGVGLVAGMVANVYNNGGSKSFEWDSGTPPSAKAGRALDLQRAAAARVRKILHLARSARYYWIDDAGKVAEGDDISASARLGQLRGLSDDMAARSFPESLRAVLFPDHPAGTRPIPYTGRNRAWDTDLKSPRSGERINAPAPAP